MNDAPLDLTGGADDAQLSPEEIEKRLPKFLSMGGFDPDDAEVGETWFVAPSLTQSLTPENMLAYLSGEKTMAELYGLTVMDLYALADVGCGMFREGKLNDARQLFEMLVALNPRHAWFRNLLGTAFLRLDMDEAAGMQYKKAIELDPKLPEPWVNLADLAVRQEDWGSAFVAAQHVLDVTEEGKSQEAVARAKVIIAAIERARAKRASEQPAAH